MLFLLIAGFVLFAACGSALEQAVPIPSHDNTTVLEIVPLATSEQTSPPVFMGEARTIAMGNHRAVRVMPDGRVTTVGSNSGGRLSIVNGWDNIVAVDIGNHNIIGLRSDGTVVEEGLHNYRGRPLAHQGSVDSWCNVVAVATSGWHHSVGLRSDGTVVTASRGNYPSLFDANEWYDIVAVAVTRHNTIGLRSDGTVVATQGPRARLQVSDWQDIVAISAGAFSVVGLRSDGTLVSTSSSDRERDVDVSAWRDIVAISSSERYTLGLKSDGTVVAVISGPVRPAPDTSDWYDIVAISAGNYHAIGLRSDGTLVVTRGEYMNAGNITAGSKEAMRDRNGGDMKHYEPLLNRMG